MRDSLCTSPPSDTQAPSVATTVITADEPGEAVYVILSGSAKVHVIRPDGTEVILAVLGPGDVAGEMSNALSPK
jgi:CRP-like cAMP-binding protein